jgi:protoporphyrin/coproporphyrin ferrochelatase
MKSAVLLMAHGTPASLDEMPEYLRLVRGGRPPSPELVAEMRHNYQAIGGRSPLTDITIAQAEALGRRLGADLPVAVGMRNWQPFIKDALEGLAGRGIERVIGVPMAPQFSTLSVQKYVDAATAALPAGLRFEAVTSYHAHPLLLQAFAERVREATARRGAAGGEAELVIFTAHSLPLRVIEAGDVYADEVAATARGVAELAGISRFEIAYQSAGRTPEPWIGPDLGDLITARIADGTRSFLVVPVGFVCDHTEILFDIDVQAARTATDAGAMLRRTESLNTSPTFIAALEHIVRGLV